MPVVFVCKKCDFRPCFYQCDKAMSPSVGMFDEGCLTEPGHCPMDPEREPEWELLLPDVKMQRKLKYNLVYEMNEWLNGEGWDNCPEELQEFILSFGINVLFGVDTWKAREVFGILCNYDSGNYLMFEDFKEELKKYSKMEIVAGLLPEAIRIGVIWREKYLQEHGK